MSGETKIVTPTSAVPSPSKSPTMTLSIVLVAGLSAVHDPCAPEEMENLPLLIEKTSVLPSWSKSPNLSADIGKEEVCAATQLRPLDAMNHAEPVVMKRSSPWNASPSKLPTAKLVM